MQYPPVYLPKWYGQLLIKESILPARLTQNLPGALLSDNIELLLSEVVRLNLSRLRSRLKLKKRNSVDNGPIAQLVKFYRGTNRDLDSGKVLLELDSLTRVFKSAPSSPPTSSTCQTAMTIVKLASKLTTTDFLDIVGRCVSGQDRLARCIDTVRKIGQYYRATKQLVVAATAIHSRVLFQHIQVCPFRIEVPSCVRTIVCVDTGAKQAALHAAVLSRLNKQRSGLKIHAEIQLLFFYEQHQVACPPRVIVASKASCYLCNLFLELHGKFQVVSSYGKLNERWILPDWLHGINSQQRHQLCYIVEQFYAALSAKCEAGVFKKKLPDPIESLIAISAVWNESVLTTPSLTCCEPEGIPSSQHATPPTVIKAQRRETRLLTECELPYIFAIHPGLQRLTVEFGTLRLIFDFESHSASALSISQDGEEGSAVEVDALTIPTTSAVEVSRRTDSHDTVFRIRHGRIYIDIKIFGSGSGSQAI